MSAAWFLDADGLRKSDEFYLEKIWGGTWARGQRIAVRGGHVDIVSDLWMA